MDEMSRSEASKIWENLTIADNFIFQKVMRKKRLCKRFIEKILHIKIRKIMFPETEKGINVRRDSKSVRLDVYVEDDKGTLYDIEMQTTDYADPAELVCDTVKVPTVIVQNSPSHRGNFPIKSGTP